MRVLDDLRRLSRRHAEMSAAFRLTGERNLSVAHYSVAMKAANAVRDLEEALQRVERAKPMPAKVRAIATRADGQPAHTRSVA